jgi:hypothetical protein
LLLRLIQERGDLTLLPPAVLRLDLSKAPSAPVERPQLRRKPQPEGVSWWTARATPGDVAPGFTRESILAERPVDPGAAGGLFERVGQVLDRLRESLVPG